jgi:hypothetical protein
LEKQIRDNGYYLINIQDLPGGVSIASIEKLGLVRVTEIEEEVEATA